MKKKYLILVLLFMAGAAKASDFLYSFGFGFAKAALSAATGFSVAYGTERFFNSRCSTTRSIVSGLGLSVIGGLSYAKNFLSGYSTASFGVGAFFGMRTFRNQKKAMALIPAAPLTPAEYARIAAEKRATVRTLEVSQDPAPQAPVRSAAAQITAEQSAERARVREERARIAAEAAASRALDAPQDLVLEAPVRPAVERETAEQSAERAREKAEQREQRALSAMSRRPIRAALLASVSIASSETAEQARVRIEREFAREEETTMDRVLEQSRQEVSEV